MRELKERFYALSEDLWKCLGSRSIHSLPTIFARVLDKLQDYYSNRERKRLSLKLLRVIRCCLGFQEVLTRTDDMLARGSGN